MSLGYFKEAYCMRSNTTKKARCGLKTSQFPWSLPCWKALCFYFSTIHRCYFSWSKKLILLTVKTNDLKHQVWELNFRWLCQDQERNSLNDLKVFGSCAASDWFHASAHDKHNLSLEGVELEKKPAKRKSNLTTGRIVPPANLLTDDFCTGVESSVS